MQKSGGVPREPGSIVVPADKYPDAHPDPCADVRALDHPYDFLDGHSRIDIVNDVDRFLYLDDYICAHRHTHTDADECGHLDGNCDARSFTDSNLVAYGNADGHLYAYRYGYADTDEHRDTYGHH
jgi:hypothetical protein